MSWAVNCTPQVLYARIKPRTLWTGSWVDPRAGPDFFLGGGGGGGETSLSPARIQNFYKVYFNILLPSTHLWRDIPSLIFVTQVLYAFVMSRMCSTCPYLLIIIDLITLCSCWRIMKLFILQFSPASCPPPPPLRFKYSSQYAGLIYNV